MACYLYDAWHDLRRDDTGSKQSTVPVLEAVDSFLFGIVLVIFAYGIAIGFVFTLPEGYGQTTAGLDEGGGVGQLKATLAEVVIVVLIVIFARIVVGGRRGSFQLVDARASRLDPAHRGGAAHDRTWRRTGNERGGCRPLVAAS